MSAETSPDWATQGEKFKRQYLQLIEPKDLSWPAHDTLRNIDLQTWLYHNLFDTDSNVYLPPERYRLRVLKQLLKSIEESITDPEEDVTNIYSILMSSTSVLLLEHLLTVTHSQEISDDLSAALALLMSQQLPPESTAAQTPSYVTYTFPEVHGHIPKVTLLELRAVIASFGTTGRRTWEAALHLGNYLASTGVGTVKGKKVLELGAGTGLVSILCARWLGAEHVTATDGDDSVVEDLQKNMFLNDLENSRLIYAKPLRWGRAFEEGESGQLPSYDLVLGADITYDSAAIPALVASFRDLFLLNPKVEILVGATIRNADTFATFERACEQSQLSIVDVDFPVLSSHEQNGPFYAAPCPIRIVQVKAKGVIRDPFAF